MSRLDPGAAAPGRIGPHYRIVGRLGSGGMGTVYRAYDEQLEREVAIKRLDAVGLDLEQAKGQLRAEARAMARVRHPNVVAIHAYDVHEGLPYFVMEYVEGGNLAQWQRASTSPTRSEVVRILAELATGVHAIHAEGAVHRDLKPSNVLVAKNGRVAVCDLGLSDIDGPLLSRPDWGTPAYLAPELTQGRPVTAAHAHLVDVYALGVIAFELLTGQRPFRARAVPGLLAQHAFSPPPTPSQVARTLPSSFDPVILRALAKDPEKRTPSAAVFLRELRAAGHDTSMHSPPLRVLIADDDTSSRDAMRELLLSVFPNADVEVAADAASTIERALRRPPDVLITDLKMPRGGGVEVASALRRHPRTARAAIVVVTAFGGGRDWQRLRKLGVDRFLVKPIDIDSLIAVVRSILRRSSHPAPGSEECMG